MKHLLQKTLLFTLLLLCVASFSFGQITEQPTSYRLMDKGGREISFATMIAQIKEFDVVFFGEMHNCPVTHWLEYRVMEALQKSIDTKLMVGMEMLEWDNQLIIDEFMQGLITEERFLAEARLWHNYATDYAPIVDWAKETKAPLVATNVPRRYANSVKNKGWEVLQLFSKEAQQYMPPLPIPTLFDQDDYQAFEAMAHMAGGDATRGQRMAQAQALKDATMAWRIVRSFDVFPSYKMIHFNGSYHSDNHKGIISFLKGYRSSLKVVTIKAVRQETIDKLDEVYEGLADYFILIPEDMPFSY